VRGSHNHSEHFLKKIGGIPSGPPFDLTLICLMLLRTRPGENTIELQLDLAGANLARRGQRLLSTVKQSEKTLLNSSAL
jgi:hypothetical protein